MTPTPEIKANLEIFSRPKILKVDDNITLTPILADHLDTEAAWYLVNTSNPNIKNFLPGAHVTNLKEAKERIIKFIQGMLTMQGILYCIRLSGKNNPIGYILLRSPLAQGYINEWTIEFWLNETFQGKKVMAASLMQILGHMQNMDVREVYATVDSDNKKSIKILEMFQFKFVSTEIGNSKNMLYGLQLN